MNRPQQMMVRDGLPKACIMTPEQRAAAWAGRRMTTVPAFNLIPRGEDEAVAAFRAQVEEDRRLQSLAQIARMKNRFAAKAVDHSKMRWDQRSGKFVEDQFHSSAPAAVRVPVGSTPRVAAPAPIRSDAGAETGWSRVNKDTARTLAELNGVWDDKYSKLSGGLLVMTVTNRLKGIVKRGGTVKWQ